MRISPSEGLRLIAPALSRELVSPSAWSRVSKVARGLPRTISRACLECRLSGNDARVDLLVCTLAGDGRDVLARRPDTLQGPEWERILDFCGAWAEPSSPLHDEVPFIWLEFDVAASLSGPVAPFLFLCLQPHFLADPWELKDPRAPRARPPRERAWRIARRGLSLLRGGTRAPAMERRLATCFEQLPPGGYALHVAPLESRGSAATRLVLTLPREAARVYLERIGWRGPWAEVEALLEELHPHSSRVGLQLDVGETVGDALGIQLYFRGSDARWRPLLDALTEREACTPARRDALLAWPGQEEVRLGGRSWPVLLRRELELKLVYRPGRPVEAKAYLGFGADFVLFGGSEAPPGGAHAVRSR